MSAARWLLGAWIVAALLAAALVFTPWWTLAFAGVVAATLTTYFNAARKWTIAPFPLGFYRRVRDHLSDADIIAAAQAATLAGDPKFAESLLGRYGLELCPSCGQNTPFRKLAWYKRVGDREEDRWLFVSVCFACQENPPSGWDVTKFTDGTYYRNGSRHYTFGKHLDVAKQKADSLMYRAHHRVQIARVRVQERLEHIRRRFR